MKIATREQRMSKKRSPRLQKKLHVGDFTTLTCQLVFEYPEHMALDLNDDVQREAVFDFYDEIWDICDENNVFMSTAGAMNGKVEVMFDFPINTDPREAVAKAILAKYPIKQVVASQMVDAYHWEGWDADDCFDLLMSNYAVTFYK